MKSKNILDSFKYALSGIWYAIKNTRNLRVDLVIVILTIITGIVLEISLIEWLILMICMMFVISLEFVNTAIEEAVNLASPDIHPLAKVSKDVAAGAVLFASIMSAAIGIIIFLPKFIVWIKEVL